MKKKVFPYIVELLMEHSTIPISHDRSLIDPIDPKLYSHAKGRVPKPREVVKSTVLAWGIPNQDDCRVDNDEDVDLDLNLEDESRVGRSQTRKRDIIVKKSDGEMVIFDAEIRIVDELLPIVEQAVKPIIEKRITRNRK